MKSIVLILSYDGTPFSGWQRQDGQCTIQGSLEEAVSKMHGGRHIEVRAASRTDAGVHAEWQVAAFDTDKDYALNRWQQALNALTPREIYVREVREAEPGFHPRFAKKGKHYRYLIWEGCFLPPCLLGHAMTSRKLDTENMQLAANYLLGEHDFSAFRAIDCQAKSPIRTLTRIEITRHPAPFVVPEFGREHDGLIQIDVEGTAFLKQMVRIIVGTLIEFGLGRDAHDMQTILNSRQRINAGETAPACGLTLVQSL